MNDGFGKCQIQPEGICRNRLGGWCAVRGTAPYRREARPESGDPLPMPILALAGMAIFLFLLFMCRFQPLFLYESGGYLSIFGHLHAYLSLIVYSFLVN